MKQKIQLALSGAILLSSTTLLATNGSNLIATGSASRAMGGTGIGVAHGAENGLANAALISSVKNREVSFGGMFFMPKVKNTDSINLDFSQGGTVEAPNIGDDSGSATSDSDLNVIPEVSVAQKMSENFYLGIGIWGTAGLGVDYRGDNSGQMDMVTNLQLMQFALPMSYKKHGLSIGFAPVLQYGALDINYKMSSNLQKAFYMQQTGSLPAQDPEDKIVGAGMAQDLKMGYDLGIAYQIDGLTLGAMYKSQIDMNYKDVLTNAIGAMGVNYTNEELSTPAEIGVGISYTIKGNTFAVDYKKIKWSDAKGYQDFDWEDQNVLAIGYEYTTKKYSIRFGYNHAKSPISEQTVGVKNSAGLDGGLVNTFNTLGFPGIIETHYTVGGSLEIMPNTKVALAYVYAPQTTITYKNFLNQPTTTKHKQNSISFDLVYDF